MVCCVLVWLLVVGGGGCGAGRGGGVGGGTSASSGRCSELEKGGQWERAVEAFEAMRREGVERDTLTYSPLISAFEKGRQAMEEEA